MAQGGSRIRAKGSSQLSLSEHPRFRFYDMFSGIGAFHVAGKAAEGVCIGACDIDRFAMKTYAEWYRPEFKLESNIRDIRALPPNTDALFAGFPCPTFSIAGKSKLRSLGRKIGLEEEERGKLIFEVRRVVENSTQVPAVIVLENVKHLVHHDDGETLRVVRRQFEELGYESYQPRILNALDFGSPQNRERVFLVFFRDGTPAGFSLPEKGGGRKRTLKKCLETGPVDPKYTLGPGTWDTLERHQRYHAARGNGFGRRVLDPEVDQHTPTISARYHKDGAEALIRQTGPRPRRLTPKEIQKIFGFDARKRFHVSDTQAYRQLGNSIDVRVAKAVVKAVADAVWPAVDL